MAVRLRRHRTAARTVAAAAERLGATRLSDRVLRVAAGAAVGRLECPGRGRASQLAMYRVAGRDQVALALEAGWRTFETPMPEVFWTLCRRHPGQVVDVGANTGFYTLLALLADRRRTVTAFEPVPAILGLLADNLALGQHARRVDVRGEAVGAEDGTATLFLPPSTDHGYIETSASLSVDFKPGVSERIEVSVTTLDSWWVAAGRPSVAVVKIDVESREYDVLRGADALVARERPVLFYELLPLGDAAGIEAWARERDLVDVRLRPRTYVAGGAPAFDEQAWNHMLVPRDRLAAVESVLHDCGLVPEAA